ncbi:MAG: hypothetical protein JST35_11255 [Armatimonadetes bacterium]|nr:hypothetical protein [Armatimonadota bacterium]
MVLLALLALTASEPTTITLNPTADVWAYGHASDPTKDPFLRVWGDGEVALAPTLGEVESFSYSYLKFEWKAAPAGKLESAELVVQNVANPPFDVEASKAAPLQARPWRSDWQEKGFDYGYTTKNGPTMKDKGLYGEGSATEITPEKPVVIRINLLAKDSPFAADFAAAPKVMSMVLTSKMSPQEGGARTVYKLFSNDNGKDELRPKLILKFAAASNRR